MKAVSKALNSPISKHSERVRPFKDIPSINPFHWIKYADCFCKRSFHYVLQEISNRGGDMIRLKIFGNKILLLKNPDYLSDVIRNEGKYPVRCYLPTLACYTTNTFGALDITCSTGNDWAYKRKLTEEILDKTRMIRDRKYYNEIVEEFISKYLKNSLNEGVLHDVIYHLEILSFEVGCLTMFGQRVKYFDRVDDVTKYIRAVDMFMGGTPSCALRPSWIPKYFEIQAYTNIKESNQIFLKLVDKYLEKNKTSKRLTESTDQVLDEKYNCPLNLKRMLLSEYMAEIIQGPAVISALILHFLSKDKKRQELVYEDLKNNSQKYLGACIREALRIKGPFSEIGRHLPQDTVINNYLVPANTFVIFWGSLSSCMEKYFDKPLEFIPERWLNRDENGKLISKHKNSLKASLSFGFGGRACPGKGLVIETSASIVSRILLRFRIDNRNITELGSVYKYRIFPDKPIDLYFEERLSRNNTI